MKFYKLPSVEFNEVVDELFCHQHEKDVTEKNMVYSYFINGPRAHQCFVGSQYLLLNAELLDKCLVTDTNLVRCQQCRRCLGCLDVTASCAFPCQFIGIKSMLVLLSDRYFPKKSSFRFYHIAVSLTGRERKEISSDPLTKNFFDLRWPSFYVMMYFVCFHNIRYESKEQFFSWLMLSEGDTYSTLYFVVKTLDLHPKLMVLVDYVAHFGLVSNFY